MASADGTFLVTRWPDEPEGGIEVKLRNINFQKHAEDGPMQHRKSLRETALADTQLRGDSLPPSSLLSITEGVQAAALRPCLCWASLLREAPGAQGHSAGGSPGLDVRSHLGVL